MRAEIGLVYYTLCYHGGRVGIEEGGASLFAYLRCEQLLGQIGWLGRDLQEEVLGDAVIVDFDVVVEDRGFDQAVDYNLGDVGEEDIGFGGVGAGEMEEFADIGEFMGGQEGCWGEVGAWKGGRHLSDVFAVSAWMVWEKIADRETYQLYIRALLLLCVQIMGIVSTRKTSSVGQPRMMREEDT